MVVVAVLVVDFVVENLVVVVVVARVLVDVC